MNSSAKPLVSLSELLPISAINLQLTANSREAVLVELVGQIAEIAANPEARRTLLQALEERERLHSTGIGDGIALPHARNALVGLVDHPILVFGRHAEGISFGAIDGAPAQLFFLLVAPTVTQHLAMLDRISRLLRDPKLRKALLSVESEARVQTLMQEAEAKL